MLKREMKKLNFCVIEVTQRCMFRCKMCHTWKSSCHGNEMSNEELSRFIMELKGLASDSFGINIAGGEPLMRQGIFELIEFIGRQDFPFSSMVTNGFLLDRDAARRVADSGLTFLPVSLDSMDETVHDTLRGTKGACIRAKQAVGYLNDYRGRLKNINLQTIIMGPNLEGILDLTEWVQDNGISVSFMALMRPNMVPIDPFWYRKEEFNSLWPKDIPRVYSVIDALIARKNSGYRIDNPIAQLERFKRYFANPQQSVRDIPCYLGDKFLNVNHQGDAHLCCEMGSIGNVKKDSIRDLWHSEKAEDIRERIRRCRKNCAGMVNCYKEEMHEDVAP